MKTHLKAGLLKTLGAVLTVAGASLVAAAPAGAQSFGLSIGGPRDGVTFSYDSGGYCDAYGCPDDFWNMPVYYGPVFWAGSWFDGPVYYRDWFGRRQYWIHGSWHFDEWRGPRPSWYREGRFGPALGERYYRDHGFHGRWDRDDGRGRPGFAPREERRDFRELDRRDDHRDNGRNNNGRPNNWGQQQQAAPHAQQPPRDNGRDSHGRPNNWGQNQPQQQAAPQPAAPAQPPQDAHRDRGNDNNNGDHHRRDH